jgi:hypothetical protein
MSRFSIHGYVGVNGSGKTYAVAHQVIIPAWRQHRPVWANMRLFPEAHGYPADLYRPLDRVDQLDEMFGGVVVLDEISAVLPAREFADMGPDLVRRINQLRKVDMDLVWTAPAFARADKSLREVTQAVTFCKSWIPDPWLREPGTGHWWRPFGVRVPGEDGQPQRFGRGWAPRCYFQTWTYDVSELPDTLDQASLRKVKPRSKTRHWRPFHRTQLVYDTLGEVGLFDHVGKRGTCLRCGGRIVQPKCDCEPVRP